MGRLPSNLFLYKFSSCRLLRNPSARGNEELRLSEAKSRYVRLFMFPMAGGKDPVNSLLSKLRLCRLVSSPSSVGSAPRNLLVLRCRYVSASSEPIDGPSLPTKPMPPISSLTMRSCPFRDAHVTPVHALASDEPQGGLKACCEPEPVSVPVQLSSQLLSEGLVSSALYSAHKAATSIELSDSPWGADCGTGVVPEAILGMALGSDGL